MRKTYWERMARITKEAKDLIKNCKENNCPYLKRFAGSKASKYEIYTQYYCGYCDVTGHARLKESENVDPHKCTHWKDEIKSIKTQLIDSDF